MAKCVLRKDHTAVRCIDVNVGLPLRVLFQPTILPIAGNLFISRPFSEHGFGYAQAMMTVNKTQG
jgi:hypothetical protein